MAIRTSVVLGISAILSALSGIVEARSPIDHFLATRARIAQLAKAVPSLPANQTANVKNITFANPKAAEFYVDGKSIPDVGFDAGPSWAGLLPISNATNESRKVSLYTRSRGNECMANDRVAAFLLVLSTWT